MEHYSALKAISICVIIWMNLENIMLGEINQTQRRNIVWFHLYKAPRGAVEFTELESRIEVTRGWEGMRNFCLVGIEFQFRKVKKVLEMDSGVCCTTTWTRLMLWNCALKMVTFTSCIFHHKKNKSGRFHFEIPVNIYGTQKIHQDWTFKLKAMGI